MLREREARPVITQPVEQREMVEVLETTSVLESELEIQVVPRASGRVLEVLAEEGDAVQTGALLARLDDEAEALALRDSEIAVEEADQRLESAGVAVEEARNGIATAEANLAQAERDLERDEALRASTGRIGSVSEKVVEASRLARDQAAAELERARLALSRAQVDEKSTRTALARAELTRDQAALTLERLTLRAPFDGVVAERMVRVGQEVGPADPAFVLTDPNRLRTVFFRPQSELARFQVGDELRLTATAEALPGARFAGTIQRTSPTIDPSSGNFRVTATLDPVPIEGAHATDAGLPLRLAPGMLLRLEIVTDSRPDALVVPKRAVQREGDRTFVYGVEDGRAVKLEVREGFSDEDAVQIVPVDGIELAAGDEVVVVGARDLEDGELVRTQHEVERAAEEPEPGLATASPNEPDDPGGDDDATDG